MRFAAADVGLCKVLVLSCIHRLADANVRFASDYFTFAPAQTGDSFVVIESSAPRQILPSIFFFFFFAKISISSYERTT